MKFAMSSAIAVQADDAEQARRFYGEVLGFAGRQDGGFDASPLTLFIDSDKRCEGVLLELLVDDLEAARQHLQANGCEILAWEGAGGACVVRDPFGVHFNIWQQDKSGS